MRTVRVHVPILVTVAKVATNEVDDDGWVPSPADVAEEVAARMVGRDLDTGWEVIRAAPGGYGDRRGTLGVASRPEPARSG